MQRLFHGPIAPRLVRSSLLAAAFFLLPSLGLAQTNSPLYWNSTSGAGVFWDTASNWWTTPTGTVSASAPGAGNDAVFNGTNVNGDTTVQLEAAAAAMGLYFDNSGSTLIESSSATNQVLSIGTDGITSISGSGAATIGSATNPLSIALLGSQTWTNNSFNALTIAAPVSLASSVTTPSTLTLAGNSSAANLMGGVISNGGGAGASLGVNVAGGTWVFAANNSYTGPTKISGNATLQLQATQAPTAGLVSFYGFQGNTNDPISGNNGTLRVGSPGTANASFVTGFSGQALSFNGTNQYVALPNTSSLDISGAYTFSMWMNPGTQTTADPTLFSARNGAEQNFDVQVIGTHLHGDIGTGGGWLNTGADSAGGSITPNVWQMVTYSVSSTGYTIYVNGVNEGSGAYSGTPLLMSAANPGQFLSVGSQGAGGASPSQGNSFIGSIELLNIYNTALTQSQVSALYAAESSAGILPAASPVSIASGSTLDLAGNNQTVASLSDFSGPGDGGSVINSASIPATLTINPASGSTTFSGVISDGGAANAITLVKTGAGTQVLGGANNYSGPTLIQNGTLALGTSTNSNVGSLPFTANVVLGTPGGSATGILQLGDASNAVPNQSLASLTTANAALGNAVVGGNASISNLTINNSSPDVFNGTLGGSGTNQNQLSLTMFGTSTLSLGGVSTYVGQTTIATGTLEFTNEAALYNDNTANWTGANITVFNNATLAVSVGPAPLFTAGDITTLITNLTGFSGGLGFGSTFAIDTSNSGGSFTSPTPIVDGGGGSNPIGFAKIGAGTLILTGANTYSGPTTVASGTLRLQAPGSLSPSTALTVAPGATFDLGGVSQTVSSLADSATFGGSGTVTNSTGGPATFTINLSGGTSNFSGAISDGGSTNALSLLKNGSGTQILSGFNTYSGATIVAGGTLQVQQPVIAPGLQAHYAFQGNVNDLTTNGNNGMIGFGAPATTNPAFVPGVVGQAINFNGLNQFASIPNSSSLAISGPYTVSFFANLGADYNTQVANGAGNPTFFSTRNGGGSNDGLDIQLSATGLHGDIGNTGGWITTGADAAATLTPGTWEMITYSVSSSGYNIYVNGVNVGSGSYAATPVLMSSGDSQFISIGSQAGGGTTPTSGNAFNGSIDELNIFSSALTAAQVNALYTSLGATVLPSATPLTVGSGATFDLAGTNETVASLSDLTTTGNGGSIINSASTVVTLTVNPPSGSTTFSGTISDSGSSNSITFVKTGAGTQVLAGANTYSGPTLIQNGTLVLGTSTGANVGSILSTSNVTLGSSDGTTAGVFQLGDAANPVNQTVASLTTANNLLTNAVVGGNAAISNLTVNNSSLDVFNGTLGGTGTNQNQLSLTMTGSGTLRLGGASSYSGKTTITSGTVDFSNAATLYNANPANWISSNITVSSGATLAVGVGAAPQFTAANLQTLLTNLGGASGGFANGATLGLDATNAGTAGFVYPNAIINGNGGANALNLTTIGTGTSILTAANTYTGVTTIGAGSTLQVGNGGTAGSLPPGKPITDNGTLAYDLTAVSVPLLITGSGGVAQVGSGSLTLTNQSTYTGPTLVEGGTLRLGGTAVIPVTTTVEIASGANFDLTGTSPTIGDLADYLTPGNGGMVINSGSTPQSLTLNPGVGSTSTYSGVITDNGSTNTITLVKTGAGTQILAGANTYSGPTKIQNGILALANPTGSTIPANSAVVLGNASPATAGILQIGDASNAANQTIASLTTANSLSANAVVGGNAAISTLTINNPSLNTFNGAFGGSAANQNNLGVTIAGGGTLAFGGQATNAGATAITGNSTFRPTVNAPPPILNGNFTTPNIGNNNYIYYPNLSAAQQTALIWVGNASAVVINNSAAWGYTTPYPVGNQGISLQDVATLSETINFPAPGNYVFTWEAESRPGYNPNPSTILLDGTTVDNWTATDSTQWLPFSATLNVTSAGNHTIEFSTAGVSGQDVSVGVNDVAFQPGGMSPNSQVQIATGSTLDLFGTSQTVESLANSGAGGGTVTSSAAGVSILSIQPGVSTSASFGGVIQDGSGTLRVAIVGPGTQTFSGANTYSGGTMINTGTLAVGNSSGSATGSGPIQVNSTGTLQSSNMTGAVSGLVTVASGGAIAGSSGTSLNLNGGLALQANSISNFALTAAGVNNAVPLVNVGGTFSVASQHLVNISGSAANGVYDLYGYTAGQGPTSVANFILNTPPPSNTQWLLTNNSATNQVDLMVGAQFLQATSIPIVVDDFSITNAAANANNPVDATTATTGRSPSLVNRPGTTYSTYTIDNTVGAQPGIITGSGNPAPSANTGFNGATYLNIASNPTANFTLPTNITISADIQLGSIILAGANTYRGIGLGFFAGTPINSETSTTFTGLVVNPDGTLRLVAPGSVSGVGSTTFLATPFAGFNPNNFYNLSYTVNTTTGAISNVIFNGNDDSADFNTTAAGFEPNADSTVNAGFYGSTDTNNAFFGQVDNFSVVTITGQSLNVSTGFTYNLTGPLQVTGVSDGGGPGGTINLNGNTLTVGTFDDTTTTTFSGNIADGSPSGGALVLDKAPTGGLILSGTNTFTGLTSVNGGTLRVNGSLAGPVTVGDQVAGHSATLTGSGTIHGLVTINGPGTSGNAGTLAATNGSTLTLSGGLTIQAGALTSFNLTGTPNGFSGANPLIALTSGTLTVAPGDYTVNLTGTPSAGDYDLVNFSGLTGSNFNPATTDFILGTTPVGFSYSLTANTTTGQLDLVVTTVNSSTWSSNSDSHYGNTANWTPMGVPSGVGASATFGTGSQTNVSIDGAYILGALNFSTGSNFTLSSQSTGSGFSLTLNNGSTGAQVNVAANSTAVVNTTLILADSSGAATTTFNVASGSTLRVGSDNGTDVAISGSGQALKLTGGGTMVLTSPNNYSGATTVQAGTLKINAGASVASTSVAVAAGGTLQLAGSTAALPSAASITTQGTGAAGDGAVSLTGAATQTVGSISGTLLTATGVTTYAGNTTVGDGSSAASLTAGQILQNTLTINANSTVTIAPSAGAGGGAIAADSSATSAVAFNADAGSGSGSDALSAIQTAIASGSISGATGQRLENRIAAIDRLAAANPGLDVSLLESRVLAALPSSSIAPSSDSSPLTDSGSGLLSADSSAFGSGSSAAGAASAPAVGFGGSPAAVPEPSTLLLAALACIGLMLAVRRRTSSRIISV